MVCRGRGLVVNGLQHSEWSAEEVWYHFEWSAESDSIPNGLPRRSANGLLRRSGSIPKRSAEEVW